MNKSRIANCKSQVEKSGCLNLEEKKLKDLVLAMPGITPILERFQLDYCCGGDRTLKQACAGAGVDPAAVTDQLQKSQEAQSEQSPDWQTQSLAALISHIVSAHHAFVRRELPRLEALLAKVTAVHGARHPELPRIGELFARLKEELELHMYKEERMLFPYVRDLEEQLQQKRPAPAAPFGTVKNPITMMQLEHEHAGEALRAIRAATSGYAAPPDGCASYRSLYQGLQAFEEDLHLHIHLENNILFPRAEALERGE